MIIEEQVVCTNIGPQERRRRMRFGISVLVAGIGIALALILLGAERWWRAGLFFPFYVSAIGFFQAHEKT